MYGWAGTILRVDLGSGTIERHLMDEHLCKNFVGGRGISAKLLFDEVGPEIEPLSPYNKLIFSCGPLSGTSAPSPARFHVTSKSPLTGIMGNSNAGGYFGPAMKRAGFDHLVIQGKAQEPVYLWINDDKIEIKSARHLWGKNIREAEAQIKEELGDRRVRVAAIGQAGENLVSIANIIHEERSASRTGMGAVMGSKNLKAVAIQGTKDVQLFDPDGFNRLAKEFQQRIAKSDKYEHFRKNGGSTGTYATDKAGFLAIRNFQQTGGFEGIENFNPKNVAPKFYISNKPCFKCPIGCGKKFEVKEGPYAGEWGNKIEEGAFTPLGPVCGNNNIASVFKMNNMGNQLGLDLIEFASGMAVVMEWYEKGIVTEKDLDGIQLTWGNHEAMAKMMEKVAFRQGVGDVLAEGIVKASRQFGKEAEAYVSHSKGMVMGGVDSRIMKGTSLGFATSTRGACHLTALVPVEFPAFPVMTKEEAEAKFGTADVMDPSSYKKASPLIYYQHKSLMCDLFQVCKFLLGLGTGTKDFSFDNLYTLFYLATGVKVNEEEMLTVAERVHNVERAYSCREGLDRKDDRLIGKWANEPVPNGPYKGEKIDSEKWEVMLDEYYRLRGWDEKGIPKKEKLKELGLDDVADELEQKGVYS
ncbi:MAG: aldehyde ferredoxin oxidoreductase family protein [Deltaproteobacteria bacterium]|nr:aldehyde ferredoxin oxidoreductase family protein [Deltaproteobacteria bacterium]MBW2652093.1 aldehyde ferredoxin oxidoreductase family protein [Deltaproteobacteria bacterium]MCK5420614.1 aldehyde ferredoxin oxidoreductase family protein [Deltaproteobacteria bacterium]NOQ85992.1 aldehyde ferredoxin oxidoreductase [Deltaproteobacteria bacterium]